MDENIYKTPGADVASAAQNQGPSPTSDSENKAPKRIGGWLVLLALGIFLQPIRLSIELYSWFLPLFRDGTWSAISFPGSSSYIRNLDNLIIVEFLVNIGFLLISLYLVYLLLTKHCFFPKLCIGFLLGKLLFHLLDAWALTLVLPDQPFFGGEGTPDLIAQLLATLIWVPYLLVSKRVKATFTNQPADAPPRYESRKEPRI